MALPYGTDRGLVDFVRGEGVRCSGIKLRELRQGSCRMRDIPIEKYPDPNVEKFVSGEKI